MIMLTLEEIASQTGVSVRSLRYYIDKGWLPRPETRSDGPGRPPYVLPSTCLWKVWLIQSVIHSDVSGTLTAPPLGVYVYQAGGERVEVDIVSREEQGPYVLLGLRNGDYILRKKMAGGGEDDEGKD